MDVLLAPQSHHLAIGSFSCSPPTPSSLFFTLAASSIRLSAELDEKRGTILEFSLLHISSHISNVRNIAGFTRFHTAGSSQEENLLGPGHHPTPAPILEA